jgi:DNA-binding NtrC family response regulator
MPQIAIYSPDATVKSLLASALRADYIVRTDLDRRGLNALLKKNSDIDVLVIDFDSNCSSLERQLELYDEIAATPVPMVVMTDDLRRSTAVEFLRRGAFDCIRKPPSLIEFKVIVGRAYEQGQMRAAASPRQEATPSTCDQLLGSSAPALAVYDLIGRVANLSASVLITGESGTGKELVARAIHNTGTRAGRPFVAVSCGAIPETLIEAELFGHERGAYTGSSASRAGYFEQAGDGTLFLDEIGELPQALQVKFLRVLQEQEFYPLGAGQPTKADFRLLAATNQDLWEGVCSGGFREDLYYRIHVIPVVLPALRERQEDIPLLAHHFLQRFTHAVHKRVKGFTPEAMQQLMGYQWPGNIRELSNVVERAVVLATEDLITPDLILLGRQTTRLHKSILVPFKDARAAFERGYLVQLLTSTRGNVSRAAEFAGRHRAEFYKLLRKYSLDPASFKDIPE